MTSREMVNEMLKTNTECKVIIMSEMVEVFYVIYKDIEKIKNHLGIRY